MYVSRIVIRNFRNFSLLDLRLRPGVTCLVGENNTGKSNLLAAIRLALDANLSSQYRQLTEHDIHAGVDITVPQQVLASLELRDYRQRDNEWALVSAWEMEGDVARITYRFRPKQAIRDDIEAEVHSGTDLTLDDYQWELTGGGGIDPTVLSWDQQLGQAVRFSDLQSFQVVFLQALRDVQGDLRHTRISPLGRLISASDITAQEKDRLVGILREANRAVAESPTIRDTGAAIDTAFATTAGEAFRMGVQLGMADPSFTSIARALTILLSNDAMEEFEPERNGLGTNNVLYISILMEYFERRVASPRTAGQLLLIEEPEAHLHPQLQRVLYAALSRKPFQTILTTHSSHITSRAPLQTLVALTKQRGPEIGGSSLGGHAGLGGRELADLQRYLDATRSTLLFARNVILVEGPAELFLIPPLVKRVMGIDFDEQGISVIPIYGVHFDLYARLFGEQCLTKKCAIIADGDLRPSDSEEGGGDGDYDPAGADLVHLESRYVGVFQCRTTFERELAIPGILPVLARATDEAGAPRISTLISTSARRLTRNEVQGTDAATLLGNLGQQVLNTAKRVGKARFAQIASRHVEEASDIPEYIRRGVLWLLE